MVLVAVINANSWMYGWKFKTLLYGLITWGNSTESQRRFIAQKNASQILTLPSLYIFECAKFIKSAFKSVYAVRKVRKS